MSTNTPKLHKQSIRTLTRTELRVVRGGGSPPTAGGGAGAGHTAR